MQLLTVSLPFEFPTVLRSLDMIIPVTPIWKRFVHTLARADAARRPGWRNAERTHSWEFATRPPQ